MSVHRLEEMSTRALDALDRQRTVIILTVSPLEEHGPHLPLGVDAFSIPFFRTNFWPFAAAAGVALAALAWLRPHPRA